MRALRLPKPAVKYDAHNEAETRRLIELALSQEAAGAAVADATDAASAITQLNALLARIRAHGLIAP